MVLIHAVPCGKDEFIALTTFHLYKHPNIATAIKYIMEK